MKLIMSATMECLWTSALLLIIIGHTQARDEYYVRLEGSEMYSEGRVEVYVNGAWGTVCSVLWSTIDATVVCRQLGYKLGGEATHGPVHFGNGTGEVVFGDVSCRGSERNLSVCQKTLQPYCEEREQGAGVVCNEEITYDDRCEVRLTGTDTEKAGTVEVYYNKKWNTVCDEDWDMNDASVVCRQLGYPKATKYTKNASFGQGSGLVLTSRVACSGSETRLLDCRHSNLYATGCDHSRDAGVRCEGKKEYGALRLMDGDAHNEGRLEIYYDGRWGAICDVGWTKTAANVACRQLGFEYAEVENATFPSGAGPIYLHSLMCSEDSEGLYSCGHYGWDVSFTCSHDDDVGVICHQGSLSVGAIVAIVFVCVVGLILLVLLIKHCIRIRNSSKESQDVQTGHVSSTAPQATYSPNQEALTMGTIESQPPSYDVTEQQPPDYQRVPTTDDHAQA